MFFKKSEKKSHGALLVLTVGALAAVGAMSITRCGKQMMHCMCAKIKGALGKEHLMCSDKDGSQ